jgi:hypothetical protein
MMENVLYCKDLHDPIEGDSVKPTSLTDKEWDKMHRKPIECIRQCIEANVFHHISIETISLETNADTLWKKIRVFMRGRLLKIKPLQLESLRI